MSNAVTKTRLPGSVDKQKQSNELREEPRKEGRIMILELADIRIHAGKRKTSLIPRF